MTKQVIGLGAVADDGTGDNLRVAGDKINDMMDDLYVRLHPAMKGRNLYQGVNMTMTGAALTLDRLYMVPITIPWDATVDRIAINVNAAVVGNARLGIYNADPATRKPTTLILDAGTVTTNTTGEQAATISQVLPQGNYWGACVFSAAANVWRGVVGNPPLGVTLFAGGFVQVIGLYRAYTYAALSADESGSTWTNDPTAPWIGVRA